MSYINPHSVSVEGSGICEATGSEGFTLYSREEWVPLDISLVLVCVCVIVLFVV